MSYGLVTVTLFWPLPAGTSLLRVLVFLGSWVTGMEDLPQMLGLRLRRRPGHRPAMAPGTTARSQDAAQEPDSGRGALWPAGTVNQSLWRNGINIY